MWFLGLRLRMLVWWFRATKWIYTPVGQGNTRQQPIDDMLDVLSAPTTPVRTTATPVSYKATYVVLQDQDTTTKATPKATKTTKTAGQSVTTKATPATPTGNIPAWVATLDNTTTKATFARLLLDNNPEATSKEATSWWATLGNTEATNKSLLATISRMRKGR